jgi:D-specific alpha-keto acid dehydrogenase
MTTSGPVRTAGSRRPAHSSVREAPPGITVYGCGQDEAGLFRELAPRHGVVATLTKAPVSEATAALAAGNKCISVGHKSPVTSSTLLALSRVGVEYISARSIGYDHIDVDYARSVGIRVENVAYSPDSVADYTLMLILMALRNAASVIRRAAADDYRLHDVPGRELRDLTVGVVGTGRIGAAVVDRLRAFGARTLAHDTHPTVATDYVSLEELLRCSDVVTLHLPLDPATHHLIDQRRIQQMRRGALLVNTARGPLLDTEAVVRALESGRLGGAALDVLEGEDGIFYADRRSEPVGSETLQRLQRLPNVLISPHTAYYTDHALRDAVAASLASCLRFEGGNHHG